MKKHHRVFLKRGEDALSFLKERILLDMVSWKSCEEKGGGKFLHNNSEREHLDLEDRAAFMESMRKEECLE